MTKIFNRSSELEKRRLLRAYPTEAEKRIWEYLRKRSLSGYKFRRQYSIGPYITDFYCPKAKLVVEIDGSVHDTDDAIEYDKIRDEYIKSIGIKILRFSNNDVMKNISYELKIISDVLINFFPPSKKGDVAKRQID